MFFHQPVSGIRVIMKQCGNYMSAFQRNLQYKGCDGELKLMPAWNSTENISTRVTGIKFLKKYNQLCFIFTSLFSTQFIITCLFLNHRPFENYLGNCNGIKKSGFNDFSLEQYITQAWKALILIQSFCFCIDLTRSQPYFFK